MKAPGYRIITAGIITVTNGSGDARTVLRRRTNRSGVRNRATLQNPERHRAQLYMPVDEEGNNRCIACRLCETACPNGTISITTTTVTDEETGKTRKALAEYRYDLGSCTFCQLCVNACPKDAIKFNNKFENAVFDRNKLILKLNK